MPNRAAIPQVMSSIGWVPKSQALRRKRPCQIGFSCLAPWEVALDQEVLATFDNSADQMKYFHKVNYSLMRAAERSEHDKARHRYEMRTRNAPRFRVHYFVEGSSELHSTPWFYRDDHARHALELMRRRYGRAMLEAANG